MRGAFTAIQHIGNYRDYEEQHHMLHSTVSSRTLLSNTWLLGRAEALPLLAPPTLLGVVLPECEWLRFGENRFTN
jgi:hypothetical protein